MPTPHSQTFAERIAYSYSAVPEGPFADQWGSANDAFQIGTFDVTNAQYAAFLTQIAGGAFDRDGVPFVQSDTHLTAHLKPISESTWQVELGFENYPAVYVTWAGAQAFCQMLGARLPTATERHKAAVWQLDGRASVAYPWGNKPPDAQHANFGMMVGSPSAIDAYPTGRSALGAYDLAGNVANWTSSYNGNSAIKLGGAFDSAADGLRADSYDVALPQSASATTGFRCAR